MAKFVNLTPHEIRVVRKDGSELRLPPSGRVARLRTVSVPVGEVEGVPIVRTELGHLNKSPKRLPGLSREGVLYSISDLLAEDLPEPQEGVFYIVSSMVAEALSWRKDLLAPDTSPASAVRDEQGRIVGIRRFQVFW
ncbi:hypothetical protein DRO48_01235 [Candidatus Bathyarchaeota archaeon]|nr:MAG: hypothetical protein DRO48_01235 [Candidatus Bathyarchaeota archaeon]